MTRTALVLASIAFLASVLVTRPMLAQDRPGALPDSIAGDVWYNNGARTVRISGALVYLWPSQIDVTSVLDSACAAARSDPDAWLMARRELNHPDTTRAMGEGVVRNLGILRAMTALPHSVVSADTAGHFKFESVPYGSYWVEAEAILNGSVVQWWAPVIRTPVADDKPVQLGPHELHSAQFCVTQ